MTYLHLYSTMNPSTVCTVYSLQTRKERLLVSVVLDLPFFAVIDSIKLFICVIPTSLVRPEEDV